MYRILWHDMFSDHVGAETFQTVTEAVRAAEQIQRAYIQRPAPGYDIVWAGSGRVIPDWRRWISLERGE